MTQHSLEEARAAKQAALERLAGVSGIGAIGIGCTPDGTDRAVTVNVSNADLLGGLPSHINGVPVRGLVVKPARSLSFRRPG